MKKLFFITLLGLIFFASCETDEDSNQWIVNNVVYEKLNDTSVKVTGAQQGIENLFIPASITVTMGDKEKVFEVTEIGNNAFSEKPLLTEVIISNSIVKIGERAFYNCGSLQEVWIGTGVAEIGDWAFFSNGFNIPEFCILPTTPPVKGKSSFGRCHLYVKEDCLELYQKAWDDYSLGLISDDDYEEMLETIASLN